MEIFDDDDDFIHYSFAFAHPDITFDKDSQKCSKQIENREYIDIDADG